MQAGVCLIAQTAYIISLGYKLSDIYPALTHFFVYKRLVYVIV